MNKLASLVAPIFLALIFTVGQAQQLSSKRESPYPNELPNLKLYEDAKWKSLQPYISTRVDVDRILGEPVLVYDETLHSYVNGYEYDPDWRIVIAYVGKGGDLPNSLNGRVSHITLYPKKRVSLEGVEFTSAFRRYIYGTDGGMTGTVYYNEFGLRYSTFVKDSADGRFHAGDLNLIIYGPSDADTKKHTDIGKPRSKK